MIINERLHAFIQRGKETFLPKSEGHYYKVVYNLGKFPKLTIEQAVNELKTGKLFPLVLKKGDFKFTRNIVVLSPPYLQHLSFLPFIENDAEVIKVTNNGFIIKALPRHIFQGTTHQEILSTPMGLQYCVIGKGIPNENLFSYITNTLFVKLGAWNFFIKMKLPKALKKLEQENVA